MFLIKTAYIISWFGNDKKGGQKRRKYHNEQVDWFLKKGIKLCILAQHYSDDDYIQNENVKYIVHDEENVVLTPGQARNKLLDEFYNSDEDFAIFADNDSVLRDPDNSLSFFDEMNKQPAADYKAVDLFVPINPINEPFTKKWEEGKELYDNNHVFVRHTNIKGSLFFLRNLKKFYDLELKFAPEYDKSDSGGILGGEDGDFALMLISEGYGVYKNENVVLRELGSDSYSTWSSSRDVRVKQADEMHAMWLSRFGNKGLEKNRGSFNWAMFAKKHSAGRPSKVVVLLQGKGNTTFDDIFG